MCLLAAFALLTGCGIGMGGRNRAAESVVQVEHDTLVVTANVTEAFDAADVADDSDLRRFAARLTSTLPGPPDVLLLQEIHPAALPRLQAILTRTFGERFVPAAATTRPGTWEFRGPAVLAHETAVLLRRAAFERVGKPRFLTNRYLAADAAPEIVQRHKQVAMVTAQRKDGPLMSFSSLHFVPQAVFLDPGAADAYRARWAARIAAETQEAAGENGLAILAGDFNSSRCLNRVNWNCDEAPFWHSLTSQPFDMSDARYSVGQRIGMRNLRSKAGVDFIFTDGLVADAGSDWTYSATERSDPRYHYSDHQFHWAIVGE